MKIFKVGILILSFTMFFSILQGKEQKKQKIYIPAQVKKVMEETLKEGKSRKDIEFAIIKHLYLPFQDSNFVIFIFQAKNRALMNLSVPDKEKKKEKDISNIMKSKFEVFLGFYNAGGKTPLIFKEQYVPTELEWEANTDPEKISNYTLCTILPGGEYLLSMAITSMDLKRIGVVNYSFTLPDPLGFKENLAISPVFFIKSLKELQSPEIPPVVHKDYFIYYALQLEPKLQNIFEAEEMPDIFYFIYGCANDPHDQKKFDIDITYKVKRGEDVALEFRTHNFREPFISHPLPLKKDDKNLEPGIYRLEIKIKDKISGKELTEYVDFEIK